MNASPTVVADSRRTSLRYMPGVDGVRAISVLAVLVYHHYAIGGHEQGWAPGGFLGVEVFFVVSGYLITSLLLAERRETGRISLKRFWMRRARRLLPALGFLLAGTITFALLFLPDAIGKLRGDTVAALTYTSNWWQIIANRSYFAEAGRPSLLKHLWSLAIEEQFYLFWPPVLIVGLRRLGRRRTLRTMLGVAAASTLLMALLASGSIDAAYYGTETRLSGLLLGSALAFAFAPYRIRGVPGRGARFVLDAAGALGLVLLLRAFYIYSVGPNDDSVLRGGVLLVDVATVLVIAAAVHPVSDVGRLLGVKPLRWIGLRSYSLYLWHYPIFAITRPRLDFGNLGNLSGWPVFALRMALSFGAAEVSYRFVEQPIRSGAFGHYLDRLQAARGARKTRLATRGLVIATSLSLLAVGLGAGLANAQPESEQIFGIQPTAHRDDRGDKPDASVLAVLRHTGVTNGDEGQPFLAPGPLSATNDPTTASSVAPGTPQAVPAQVLAIGDSVMLGAVGSLQSTIQGIVVDAKKSRQFGQAIAVLAFYRDQNVLPGIVVVHLGTNGAFSDSAFDEMMRVLGNRQVFFLTAREPRPWETDVNNRLHAGAQRWANAHVLEWRDFSGSHGDWFASDGIHLTREGARAYAAFVRDGIARAP